MIDEPDDSMISKRYLLEQNFFSGRDKFKKQVIDRDLDKAVSYLKKYMKLTGILTSETTNLIDLVVDKLKQDGIVGQNTFLLATCFKNFLLSLPDN